MTKKQFASALLGLSLAVGVGGCAKDRHESIPGSAMEVSHAQGDISYTAPEDGQIYVYDVKQDELVYSGRIRKGETISVNTEDDQDGIKVADAVVSSRDLKEGNKHKIFFKEAPESERSERMASDADAQVVREEKTTVIREGSVPAEPQKTTVTETETRTSPSGNVIVEEKKTTETKP